MKQSNRKIKVYGLSALMTVLFVFLLSRLFAVLLISPDDIAMKSIISGLLTGTPDGHSVFIRYPLAVALAGLYQLLPSVEWYDLFFLGCHALCIYLVLCRVQRLPAGKRFGYLAACVGVMTLLWAKNIIHLEWTVTAGTLGATAIFRYCTMPECKTNWQRFAEYGICLGLLVLGFCLRYTVVMMYIPLAAICWAKKMFDAREKGLEAKEKEWLWQAGFLINAGAAVLAILLLHNMAYSTEEWKAYNAYTEDRSALFDYYGYPDYETYQREYEEAGISYELYLLMTEDYNYIVADHFEDVDLHAVATLAESIYNDQTIGQRISGCMAACASLLQNRDVSWAMFLLVLLLGYHFSVSGKRGSGYALYIAGALAWFVAVSLYLLFAGRFPVRVALCTIYGLIAVLGANCVEEMAQSDRTHVRDLKAVCAGAVKGVAMALVLCVSLYCLYGTNRAEGIVALGKNDLAAYCNSHPENLYFSDFWSFSQRGDIFYTAVDSPNYLRAGGWMYNTPGYDAALERYDCMNLVEAVRENGNVYYLASEARAEYVAARLNWYFNSIGEPILMELTDSFCATEAEEVMVLHFSYMGS